MPKQERSEETRTRLLQAALRCFSQAGYDATGVAEICQAAGVSKGAFYHHFASKQALFLELLNQWLSALDERFAEVSQESQSVPQALRAMAVAARQVFRDARGQLNLFLEFWLQATRNPEVWQKTIEPYQRYEAYFTEMIKAGIAEGSLRNVDPQATARSIMALAVGLLVEALVQPDTTNWPETINHGLDLILQGLEVREGA